MIEFLLFFFGMPIKTLGSLEKIRVGRETGNTHMLDHPITVVLNVFWHWKATGLKVSKVMGIQNQEEHIGHVKQLKSDRYQDRKFFSQAYHM